MAEARQARPAIQYGPTSATFAENVQRIRRRRGLSIYDLSALLKEAGRAITPSGVGKIERQRRQVTVDDLMALAVALDVSPSALLLPQTDDPVHKVEVTGAGHVPADQAWDWIDGKRRLDRTHSDPDTAALEFKLYGRPSIRRNKELGG